MDFSSKSLKKEFSKDITSKIEAPIYNNDKTKTNIDKPNKPRNKIERLKIDISKEPRKKIQREKIDLSIPPRNKIESPKFYPKAPTRNKIESRKINLNKESKHKLVPRIIDPKGQSKHKIIPRQINSKIKPKHKLQPRITDPKTPSRHKIEPQQKNPETAPRKYNNLMNPKVQTIFKRYCNDTRKYPNYGRKLTKDFIKWVEENNPNLTEKIKEIQYNQEISKYIKDSVQNLRISQSEIAGKLSANGLFVSRKSIGYYALKEVFKGNQVIIDMNWKL